MTSTKWIFYIFFPLLNLWAINMLVPVYNFYKIIIKNIDVSTENYYYCIISVLGNHINEFPLYTKKFILIKSNYL